MHILITGGVGFIGSHVSEQLYKDGHDITIIDNLSTGKLNNISNIIHTPRVRLIKQDIRLIRSPYTNLIKTAPDAIIHLAAIADVQASISNPLATHDVNVNGTLNILEMCRKLSVPKFIFASSAAVYGDSNELPIKESTPPNPNTPYGLHKLIGEQYANLYSQLFNIQTICFRFFNVYGVRQNNSGYAGLITAINKSIRSEQPFTKYGDGEQTRDFIHVTDIVEGIILSLNQQDSITCNLGTGKATSVNDAIIKAEQVFGKKMIILKEPTRNEIKHSCANISMAKTKLNWQPKINFADGLKLL